MRGCLKRLILAGGLAILGFGAVNAADTDDFRVLVTAGDVDGIERLVSSLDHQNIESGMTKNHTLREIFGQFATTHPDFSALLVGWRTKRSESIYQKIALGWHLQHLSWVVRGDGYAPTIYPKAMEQMRAYQSVSSRLAWDVFEERPDFVPASDLAANSYLNGLGAWDRNDFAKVALAANPDGKLLDKIVLTVSPKWGGSWQKISQYCEAYGDEIRSTVLYNADTCKVTAIFDMPETFRGRNLELVKWAQGVMDAAPLNAMPKARYWDLFSVRPERITPDMKDLVLSMYDPGELNAHRIADMIETAAGVEGFYEEQKFKIEAAQAEKAKRDPLNPMYLWDFQMEIFSKYPNAIHKTQYQTGVRTRTSSKATKEFLAQLEQMAELAPFRPDVWAAIAKQKSELSAGYKLPQSSLADFERAVVVSNYDVKRLA